jgi:hypothetical protein
MTMRLAAQSPSGFSCGNGTAIPSDVNMDPDGIFSASTGLNLVSSAKDYAPKIPFRQLVIYGGASGQAGATVNIALSNGSSISFIMTIAAYGYWVLPVPLEILGIYTSGTTAINIFPIF